MPPTPEAADLEFERRALAAFDDALSWPPGTRDGRLRQVYGEDPELIAALRDLLAAHDDDAGLLPTQPPEPLDLAPAVKPERIGAYRLTDLLGRGGMGDVYRGERVEGDFEQTVAIKLMRSGLFSASAAEQFAIERRILARLRHPNVTQLLDGGVTEAGLSYIIMELVEGEPLLDHAAAVGVTRRQRLALFLSVCAAIDHAHGHGIVHADIKPANVLVHRELGVKVLDFGIAAWLEGDQRVGPRGQTPRYASPEQVRGAAPTVADDIYALGMLLADLVGEATGDAELDAVMAKARAATPEQRYALVRDLSDDVHRWLDRYPVRARTPSRARAAWFLGRRHPWGVSGAAAAVSGLVVALSVITVLFIQAEQRFDAVRSLSNYLLAGVTDTLLRLPGTAALRGEVADRGRAYLETLAAAPGAGDADLRLEVAQGYSRMGEALTQPGTLSLGDETRGKQDLQRAEVALRQLMAETGGRDDVAVALARTLNARAATLHSTDNRSTQANATYDEACGLAERVLARRPADAGASLARLDCMSGRATVMDSEGRFKTMPPLLGEVLAGYDRLPPGTDPVNVTLGRARTLNLLGDAYYYLGDHERGLRTYEQALAILKASTVRQRDVRVLVQLAFSGYNVSSTQEDLGRHAEGLATITEAARAAEILRAFEDSPRARHIQNVVDAQHAVALSAVGRFDEAIAVAKANLAARRGVVASLPSDYDAARAVPVGMKPVGEILWQAGRRAEACAMFAEANAAWTALRQRGGLNNFDASDETKQIAIWLQRCGAI